MTFDIFMKKTSNLFNSIGFAGLIFSALFLLCGNLLSMRKISDLSWLCDTLKDAFQEYRSAARTVYGERKEEALRDMTAQKNVANNPAILPDIFDTEFGTTLCYDTITGKYFYSDIEKIRQAVNTLNKRLKGGKDVSLNDFYQELKLPLITNDGFTLPDSIGWTAGNIPIDICYSSHFAADDTPCFALDYTHNLQPL